MKQRKMTAVLCLVFAAAVAVAQVEDPTGPLEFSLEVGVSTTDNRDALPEKDENTDFFVKPRVDAIFNADQTYFDFYYQPTLRYRSNARRTQNDQEFLHDLGLNLRHAFTPRLTLRLGEHFNLTDDPQVEEAGETLRRDSSFTVNRVTGSLAYDFNRKSRVEVDGWHRMKSYEESELSYLDEESTAVGGRITRQATRTISLSAEARVEEFTYEDASVGQEFAVEGSSLERGFSATAAGVGIESRFQEHSSGALRVGYKQLDYEDEQLDSEGAPYAVAILQVEPSEGARLTLSARHELRDADVFPFASQTYSDLFAGIEIEASEKVTFLLSGTYRKSEYDEDSLPSGRSSQSELDEALDARDPNGGGFDSETGDETSYLLKAGVSVEIAENTVIKLAHQFEDEDSDVSVSYDRNETTASLVHHF